MLSIVDLLQKINHNVKIIFTVSPIRHIKDGFAENQLSKSSLIVAVNKAINSNKNCFYFPSYEIMMDDLRDYRFYEKDLLHPNKMAVEYIWEKFSGSFFSLDCKDTIKAVEPYAKGIRHRQKDENSPQNFKFNEFLAELKKDLLIKYPHLNI